MYHEVIISLASNCDQEQNLSHARLCLERVLSVCRFTETIWTEPISSHLPPLTSHPSPPTPKYLNQLLRAKSAFPAAALQQYLKSVERHLGRTDEDRRQGIVRIDLDLLQHDGQRYHLADWERPYVQALINM